MKQYGLTPDDLKFARMKREQQHNYLSNNFFHTSTGQVKSLLDVSFSANLSERYYAQLSNKINTMHTLAMAQYLSPTFLTITLDGFFRGMLTGNYKKWDRLSESQKKEYLRHIPNNDVYGYVRDKIISRSSLTIKDLYNVLAFQWYRFSAGYAFKKLKKSDKTFIYLKAAEPHADGVPHFHVLLWIPKDNFDNFRSDFKRYFPAPRNHAAAPDGNEGDTYGFQTAIHNPVGYIMKYATKSFMDLRSGEDMNYLQAWYIKHKIRRITTSHSTIPQWVYQKCYAIEKDWHHLTDLNLRDPMLCEWDRESDYFILIEDNGRTIEYDRGVLTLRYIGSDRPIKQFGEFKTASASAPRKLQPVPSFWTNKPEPKKFIDVFIDNDHYLYREGEIFKQTPQPLKMSDLELLEYRYSLDPDDENINIHHFYHVRNVAVSRGLLKGDPVKLGHHLTYDIWGYYDV